MTAFVRHLSLFFYRAIESNNLCVFVTDVGMCCHLLAFDVSEA